MEQKAAQVPQGVADSSRKNQEAIPIGQQGDSARDGKSSTPTTPGIDVAAGSNPQKDDNMISKDETVSEDAVGEVNMEASIRLDDVERAGGLGARDDISSFLPAASDSTDFEVAILDARDYEEPQADVRRPGLGWKEGTERK